MKYSEFAMLPKAAKIARAKRAARGFSGGGSEFQVYLERNWHIVERALTEAYRARKAGKDHYSMRTIVEYIRHETELRDGSEYRVNNNAAPAIARLAMALIDELSGMFRTRERAA